MATDQPPNDSSAEQNGGEHTPAPQAHGASATPPPPPYGKPPGEYDPQQPGYQEAPQGYQQAPQPGYQQAPHGYQQPPQGYHQSQAPGPYQQVPPPGAYPQGYPQGAAGPYYGFPEPKSRLAAGLLGIFLGGLGIHRFYLGYTTLGVVQLLVTFFTFGFGAIWGFVEGIMILAGAQSFRTDSRGVPLRE
ncbi:NINE protein [Arthrobacter sp. BL-252-APC-1A]|uniref:TM2 domain-containing protein n=1 Tax=Arthrobacter sp. BL-252-APC-1A TaxID=2606622 RepID=UPI0012B2080B|nr:TM2 domain-containing protein [Arthrobacter sp. BL-252-APC-1A]MSR98644.1 NINE protein [Arthrobacter sp. BL-252-APC-1A]